jgi:3-methyladenine DNA glycosylase AlkD
MVTMKLVSEVVNQAFEELHQCSSEKRREGMRRYFTSSMDCIGVAVPELRKVSRGISAEMGERPRKEWLEFAGKLLDSRTMEARHLVYEVLSRHPATMASLSVAQLEELGSGNDNWGSVDAFAVLLTGVLWQRGSLRDETVFRWACSPSVWWRRTAVVSAVPLNLRSKGGSGDTRRTLQVVEAVKSDRHPMVAKAVSWALRSLVPWDPEAVRKFLEDNDAVLAPLVKREVRNKLNTGLKNPRS